MTNQERILSNNNLIDEAIAKANSLPDAGSGSDNSMLLDLIQGGYKYDYRNPEKSFVLNIPLTNITKDFGNIIGGVVLVDINVAKLEANSLGYSTNILILRYDGVTTLDTGTVITSTNIWDIDGDPECGGYIYVPQKYLSQYKSSTNWAGVNNGSIHWMTIEGSEYE
jgi:hypothetical protein